MNEFMMNVKRYMKYFCLDCGQTLGLIKIDETLIGNEPITLH